MAAEADRSLRAKKRAKTATTVAETIKGFKYLLKEIPELKIAVISESLAIFDVNQITAKKTKIGYNVFPKYQIKFK